LLKSGEPLTTVVAANDAGRFSQIQLLINEWRPTRLVVGRPVHPDGQPHEMTHASERFARQLHGRFGLPVSLIDERYTSAAAESELLEAAPGRGHGGVKAGADGRAKGATRSAPKQRCGLDALAAAIILRQYWSEQPKT
jgi:putative holliday junction resolvase